MTRFNRVSANDYHIINDNLKEDSFFLEDKDDVGKVVGLLNEQQATISRLEEENEQLRNTIEEKNKMILNLQSDLDILEMKLQQCGGIKR